MRKGSESTGRKDAYNRLFHLLQNLFQCNSDPHLKFPVQKCSFPPSLASFLTATLLPPEIQLHLLGDKSSLDVDMSNNSVEPQSVSLPLLLPSSCLFDVVFDVNDVCFRLDDDDKPLRDE